MTEKVKKGIISTIIFLAVVFIIVFGASYLTEKGLEKRLGDSYQQGYWCHHRHPLQFYTILVIVSRKNWVQIYP